MHLHLPPLLQLLQVVVQMMQKSNGLAMKSEP